MNFVSDLNQEQLSAVTTSSQYCAVIAGAGSGKTRVLTYRIAYLLSEKHAIPNEILGITFTNKAAKEIKNRVVDLIPGSQRMQLSTIHSFCARFLRRYIVLTNEYSNNFTIIDEEDRKTIIKNIFVSMGMLKSDSRVDEAINFIVSKKGQELEYKDIKDVHYPNAETRFFKNVFEAYDQALKRSNSLDFDDLIIKTIKLLEGDNYGIKQDVTNSIHYILVDEFQDIDDVQFHLITCLMNQSTSLYVVGDPDQTIYTWRGANNQILLKLEDNLRLLFPKAKLETIILKNNYRSSKNILSAANKLINHNRDRIKKDLLAINPEGEEISLYRARTSDDESSYIASMIQELHESGSEYNEFAILYRSNYLSRSLEAQLALQQIPYKIFGGVRFFARREIKDLLSYFTLFINPLSDVSLERIINVPKRNIGPGSLDKIKAKANQYSQPLYLFIYENYETLDLPNSKIKALKDFIDIIEKYADEIKHGKPSTYGLIIEQFIDEINFYQSFDKDDDKDDRIDNVKELVGTIKAFFAQNPDSQFIDFVSNAELQASGEEINDGNYVSLMTVHSAKGLEFNYVFIYSFSDGIFPASRAINESHNAMEEERRLAYVAITRARKKLFITLNDGYSFVQGANLRPSPFIKESGLLLRKENVTPSFNTYNIYDNSLYTRKKNTHVAASITNLTNGMTDWNVGDIVMHEEFGIGTVIEVVSNKIIKISFKNKEYGVKSMLSSHYKIKRINN